MQHYIVRNYRERDKLTLSAPSDTGLSVSITITLPKTRVIGLGDALCERYSEALAKHVATGALTPARA